MMHIVYDTHSDPVARQALRGLVARLHLPAAAIFQWLDSSLKARASAQAPLQCLGHVVRRAWGLKARAQGARVPGPVKPPGTSR